jgi:hypothetical protein
MGAEGGVISREHDQSDVVHIEFIKYVLNGRPS